MWIDLSIGMSMGRHQGISIGICAGQRLDGVIRNEATREAASRSL